MLEQYMPSFSWFNSTRVIFGAGKLAELRAVVDEIVGSQARVFLVTGRSSLRATGTLDKVIGAVGESRITLFDRTTPFPSPALVEEALRDCRETGADIVVAIGGGSAMDLGKAVAILTAHDGEVIEYATREKHLERPGLPFVAVPTTSGSSSEVTSGSALWDLEARRHMGLGSPLMFPTVALVDPELTMTMPKTLAAVSGMDAFTSAFESYWSLESEPISDAIDLEVIRIFNQNLERSCIQGDLESRASCALAATMSGIAYSNSHPNVCHAVGAPLTIYWGIEHGQAVGISLATFLRWNAQAISHKLPALWNALGVDDLDGAVTRITRLIERCGLETRLQGLGLSDGDVDTLVDNISWDRVNVLPRPLDKSDAAPLMKALL